MGPMAQVWYSLETAENSNQKKVEVTIEQFKEAAEQVITLVGHTYNRYHQLSSQTKQFATINERF